MDRLTRFLSPQIAKLVLSSGSESVLESHRREITVVFCDLRGFTAFSETAEPEEVIQVLREYHATLGKLIHKYEATLERFAGDAIMVWFNDPLPCPDPSERAVRMAVEMRANVAELARANGASRAMNSASALASRKGMPRSVALALKDASTTPLSARWSISRRACAAKPWMAKFSSIAKCKPQLRRTPARNRLGSSH